MGWSYRRKTEKINEANIESALQAIRNGTKVRTTARLFNVPKGTLQHRVKDAKKPKRYLQV